MKKKTLKTHARQCVATHGGGGGKPHHERRSLRHPSAPELPFSLQCPNPNAACPCQPGKLGDS